MDGSAQKGLTPSQENYLEWIYRLAEYGPVRVGDLARRMEVRLPSASRAVNGLVEAGLVRHESYGAVELTPEGTLTGREIVRRHQCLTRLLVEVLGMDPDRAGAEVHRLEHTLSTEVLARLEVLVDFALSSEPWIKRLQFRIQSRAESAANQTGIRIGMTSLHAGRKNEEKIE
jgi:DtxR family Mn-dependent transcriptional regulator